MSLVLYTTACDQSYISLISSLALFSWDTITFLLRLCVSSTDQWVKGSLQPLSTSWYFWQHVHVYLHYKCISALWTALFLSRSISIYFIFRFYSLVAHSLSPWSLSLYISLSWHSTTSCFKNIIDQSYLSSCCLPSNYETLYLSKLFLFPNESL